MIKKNGAIRTFLTAFILLNMLGHIQPIAVNAEGISEINTEISIDTSGDTKDETIFEIDSSEVSSGNITESEAVEQEQTVIEDDADNVERISEYSSTEGISEKTAEDDTPLVLKAQSAPQYKSVDYIATIFKSGNSIDTLPWGVEGFKKIGETKNYIGTTVRIENESNDGLYAYGYIEGLGYGWIDSKAIRKLTAISVSYSEYITNSGYEINSLPWGEPSFQKLGNTGSVLGNLLEISYETANGAYLYATQNGRTIGWIDARAFGLEGEEFNGIINSGNFEIDTLPWGTPGYKKVGYTNSLAGKVLQVKGSIQNGGYLLVYSDGAEVGWIDYRAISLFKTKNVDYYSYVGNGRYEIDTLPWGTYGYKKLGNTNSILGNYVHVTSESMDGNYAYVSVNNKLIGWIDKKSLGLHGVQYDAIVVSGNYTIDTLPWGTPGFIKLSTANNYTGKVLTIKGTTSSGSYSLAYLDGKQIGWVDTRALKKFTTTSVKYSAHVANSKYNIDSLPWGTPGFTMLGKTQSILGQYVQVTQESENSAYAYISINGKNIGWIDKKAFNLRGPSYIGVIKNGAYNVDTLPWGTPGFRKITDTGQYFGQELDIKGTTDDGNYALVYSNGSKVGWVDIKAIKPLNFLEVKINLYVVDGTYTIYSLPGNEVGSESLGMTLPYKGKQVQVTRISENGQYYYVKLDGKSIGWININAFEKSRIVYLDPGHGGYESGASYSGVQEKNINMEVANKIRTNLEKLGMTVIMSRTYDEYVSLLNRSIDANASNAQIFVSIHHNAMPGSTTVNGIETYYYEYDEDYPSRINEEMHDDPTRILESAKLASAIHSNLVQSTGATDRGIRSETFSVLRETAVPAVLLELGYMSSPTELSKLTNIDYQITMAKAISNGIATYFK